MSAARRVATMVVIAMAVVVGPWAVHKAGAQGEAPEESASAATDVPATDALPPASQPSPGPGVDGQLIVVEAPYPLPLDDPPTPPMPPAPVRAVVSTAANTSDTGLGTAAVVSAVAAPSRGDAALPRVGVMADLGLPEGMYASLVLRPRRWVRLTGGGGSNGLAAGVRGGMTLLPWGWGLSLTLEGGHTGAGNLGAVVGNGPLGSGLLSKVSYNYANTHLGLEMGRGRFTFFVHVGFSYVRATLGDFADNVRRDVTTTAATGTAKTMVNAAGDARFNAIVLSGKLGMLLYVD